MNLYSPLHPTILTRDNADCKRKNARTYFLLYSLISTVSVPPVPAATSTFRGVLETLASFSGTIRNLSIASLRSFAYCADCASVQSDRSFGSEVSGGISTFWSTGTLLVPTGAPLVLNFPELEVVLISATPEEFVVP
jgi:hypothetical protein